LPQYFAELARGERPLIGIHGGAQGIVDERLVVAAFFHLLAEPRQHIGVYAYRNAFLTLVFLLDSSQGRYIIVRLGMAKS
jgi:hypothetical protein